MEILNNFGILTLKQIFWKVKTFLKKLGYHFLVESTKIENVSLLYKTAISEANVITDRMVCTKWTYHKEWSHASNNFIFLNIFFSLRTSWFDILTSQMSIFVQMSIFILFVSAGVWLCFFPVSILLNFVILAAAHLCWVAFLIKLQAWRLATLLKKILHHSYFPVNIAKFLRRAFAWNTSGDCFWKCLKNF